MVLGIKKLKLVAASHSGLKCILRKCLLEILMLKFSRRKIS